MNQFLFHNALFIGQSAINLYSRQQQQM